MSKVKIISKQIFGTHEDSVVEEHECEVIYIEDGFKILYDSCEINFDGEQVFIKNNQMFLTIKEGVRNSSTLATPYGALDIQVSGDKIVYTQNPFSLNVRYFIKLGNTEQYVNEIQIFVLNK